MSAYLRMVEQGERVAITRRGRVVAELGPPAHTTEEDAYAEQRHRVRAGDGAPGRTEPPGPLPSSVPAGYRPG